MKEKILDFLGKGTLIYVDKGSMHLHGYTPIIMVEYMLLTKSIERATGSNPKIVKEVQKMASKMTLEEIEENCEELAEKIMNMLEEK